MVKATIFEAKANLAELVRMAREGETVILTAGPDDMPVARIVAINAVGKRPAGGNATGKRRLGVRETPGFVLSDSFFAPLPEDELPPL